jgi:hypothetical protein
MVVTTWRRAARLSQQYNAPIDPLEDATKLMAIKTIPLSHLETDLQQTLNECADSGETVVVEMPDHRLLAIQSLDTNEDDDLIDDLLRTNPKFQSLVKRSKSGRRKPFVG